MFLTLLCNTLCPCHLDGKERTASFTLVVFLINRYCSVAFPHGAVGWS